MQVAYQVKAAEYGATKRRHREQLKALGEETELRHLICCKCTLIIYWPVVDAFTMHK